MSMPTTAPGLPAVTATSQRMVDVNIWLGRWPFRRLRLEQTPAMVAKLQNLGIEKAFAGSFDAVLHRDMDRVNALLVEECVQNGAGMLIPFGTVNPNLPDWEEDLRRCHEQYKMPGIRLIPNYHGYKLDDPNFIRLLQLCGQRKLLVQIAGALEDERTQHPLVRVKNVEFTPLPEAMTAAPTTRVMLINALRTARGGEPLTLLNKCPNLTLDIAMLEGVVGIANLLEHYPPERFVFGTHAPLYYPESSVLKLKESALSEADAKKICQSNAMALLNGA